MDNIYTFLQLIIVVTKLTQTISVTSIKKAANANTLTAVNQLYNFSDCYSLSGFILETSNCSIRMPSTSTTSNLKPENTINSARLGICFMV